MSDPICMCSSHSPGRLAGAHFPGCPVIGSGARPTNFIVDPPSEDTKWQTVEWVDPNDLRAGDKVRALRAEPGAVPELSYSHNENCDEACGLGKMSVAEQKRFEAEKADKLAEIQAEMGVPPRPGWVRDVRLAALDALVDGATEIVRAANRSDKTTADTERLFNKLDALLCDVREARRG